MTKETTAALSELVFDLAGTPLLSAGRAMTELASTEDLWLHVKVYAEGGENGIHAHPGEDHAFVVLGGRATFVDPDGTTTELSPLQGIMIPHGVAYCFTSSGEENLVMLRIGTGRDGRRPGGGGGGSFLRKSPDGGPIKNAGAPVPSGESFGLPASWR